MPSFSLGDRRFTADLIVLDKDGVLLDFHHLWLAVTEARASALTPDPALRARFVALLGVDAGRVRPGGLLATAPRTEAVLAAATGLHLWTGTPWLAAREQAERAFAAADAVQTDLRHHRALPGVPEAIAALTRIGFRLAIATTDHTDGARRFLAAQGLAPHFASVVGADRVPRSKPDPAMFALACAEARVAPDRAVMVGDGEMDLRMAAAAGAAGAFGVLSGIGAHDELAPLADGIFADVAAIARAMVT